MKAPLLEISGLTKTYPGIVACDGISLSTEPGEIHAILGENGAGKSTLVKMIYGLVRPDSGSMAINGKSYSPKEPREARKSGVVMVFSAFSLVRRTNRGRKHCPRNGRPAPDQAIDLPNSRKMRAVQSAC